MVCVYIYIYRYGSNPINCQNFLKFTAIASACDISSATDLLCAPWCCAGSFLTYAASHQTGIKHGKEKNPQKCEHCKWNIAISYLYIPKNEKKNKIWRWNEMNLFKIEHLLLVSSPKNRGHQGPVTQYAIRTHRPNSKLGRWDNQQP
jgi:hypothetical protein